MICEWSRCIRVLNCVSGGRDVLGYTVYKFHLVSQISAMIPWHFLSVKKKKKRNSCLCLFHQLFLFLGEEEEKKRFSDNSPPLPIAFIYLLIFTSLHLTFPSFYLPLSIMKSYQLPYFSNDFFFLLFFF